VNSGKVVGFRALLLLTPASWEFIQFCRLSPSSTLYRSLSLTQSGGEAWGKGWRNGGVPPDLQNVPNRDQESAVAPGAHSTARSAPLDFGGILCVTLEAHLCKGSFSAHHPAHALPRPLVALFALHAPHIAPALRAPQRTTCNYVCKCTNYVCNELITLAMN
jgi:hypothetical protein